MSLCASHEQTMAKDFESTNNKKIQKNNEEFEKQEKNTLSKDEEPKLHMLSDTLQTDIVFEGYILYNNQWVICLRICNKRYFFSHLEQTICDVTLVKFDIETGQITIYILDPMLKILQPGESCDFKSGWKRDE